MSKKYTPPQSLGNIIRVLFTTACKSNGNITKDLFLILYEYLEGVVDNGAKTVFPCSGVGNGDGTSFLDGTLFPILVEAFPEVTKEVLSAVNSTVSLFDHEDSGGHDDYINETYLSGFTDGDGSFCSATEYGKQKKTTIHSLSINTTSWNPYPTPYTEFLRNKSFDIYQESAKRCFKKTVNNQAAFVEASETCLTMKLIQFRLNAAWHKDDRDGVSKEETHDEKEYNKLKQVGDRVVGMLTSRYNNIHGVDIPMEWFYERFTKMRTGPNPLDFLLYVAGIFASDGCLDFGDMEIIQSNESFCKALALAIKDACKFGETPKCSSTHPAVGRSWNNGAKCRVVWRIRFAVNQMEQLIFLFGIFDYHQRSRWLICLIYKITWRQHDFPNKDMFLKFLQELLILLKKLAQS